MKKIITGLIIGTVIISLFVVSFFLVKRIGSKNQKSKISYDKPIEEGDKAPIPKTIDKIKKGQPIAVEGPIDYVKKNGYYFFQPSETEIIKVDRSGYVKKVYNLVTLLPGYNRTFGFVTDKNYIYVVAAKIIRDKKTGDPYYDPNANLFVIAFNIARGKLKRYRLPKNIREFIVLKQAPDGDLVGLGPHGILKFNLKNGKITEAYNTRVVTEKGNLEYTFARGGVGVDKKGNYYLGFTTTDKYGWAGVTVRIINKNGKVVKEFFVKLKYKTERLFLIGLDKQENILIATDGRPTGEVVLAYNKQGYLVKTYDIPNIKQSLDSPVRSTDFIERKGQAYILLTEHGKIKNTVIRKTYRMYSSQDNK